MKTIIICLAKIKIDHLIDISTDELEAKAKILLDDCKDLSNELFIAKAESLRKSQTWNRLPANHLFICDIEEKCNLIAGSNLFFRVNEFDDRVEIICFNGKIQEAKELSEAKRQLIRNQFNNKKIILL